MAFSEASPATRLKHLAIAKGKAEKCKRGETLTFMPMANMIGVGRTKLRDWCENLPGFAESGCYEAGDNGIKYAFKPLRTVNFLIRYFEKERDHRAAKQKRVRKLVGGDALIGAPEEFSLDDLNKMISLSIKVQEQLERQGKLIDAEKVSSALTTLFASIQQAALRSAMEQDPNGQWPPELRDAFENAIRSVLSAMERAARDCLKALAPSG